MNDTNEVLFLDKVDPPLAPPFQGGELKQSFFTLLFYNDCYGNNGLLAKK